MNKAMLKKYRARLTEQLSQLMENNEETVDQLEGNPEHHADPNDRASVESDRAFDLRLRDRDRKLIGKIKEALKRIDDGEFGTCEDCGQPIESKRLEARPVTSQCFECKEDEERRERRERNVFPAQAPAPAARSAPGRRAAQR